MHKFNTFSSKEMLSKGLANDLCEYISLVLKEKHFFTLVLSGGSTPVGVYKYIRKNLINKIDWKRVLVFWLDERAVSFESKHSNFGSAYRELFVEVKNVNLFPIKGFLGSKKASIAYENELRSIDTFQDTEAPQFDYILMGLGSDGHVASLFHDAYKFNDRFVVSTIRPDGMDRISMTPMLINSAKRIALLLSGEDKAKVYSSYVNQKIEGKGINLITSEMYLYMDKDASYELHRSGYFFN